MSSVNGSCTRRGRADTNLSGVAADICDLSAGVNAIIAAHLWRWYSWYVAVVTYEGPCQCRRRGVGPSSRIRHGSGCEMRTHCFSGLVVHISRLEPCGHGRSTSSSEGLDRLGAYVT